jgi:translocation and assembly module TamA
VTGAAALLRCLLLVLLAAGLAGCGALPWRKADPAAPPPEVLHDMYRLEVQAPEGLAPLLTRYLDLGRFQRGSDADRITTAELDRLVAAAPLQARGLLETEGYFNAEVDVKRLPAGGDGLALVRVEVRPGPRTTVEGFELNATGPLQQAAAAGDARAQQTLEGVRARWALRAGQPFRQGAWTDAKNAALGSLRGDGYPAAAWAETAARVDAGANRVSLYALADSGPLFRIGEVRVEGLERYPARSALNLATFGRGSRYSEKALLDTQERLARSGLFEGAVVEIDPDPAQADAAPVTIRVRELRRQQATIGLGYSDQSGQRLSFEQTDRRLFGRPILGADWIAKNKFQLGRDAQSWQGNLSTHPLAGGWRNFLGTELLREDAAGTVVRSARVRAGRTLETERIDRQVFAELLQASSRSAVLAQSNRAVSGNFHWTWRDVDSVLLPTEGITVSTESAAGFAWSTGASNGPFGRMLGRVTVYRPLAGGWYATGRVQAGQVITRRAVGIPDTLLFRAGGDDSVRGYAYRSLGPQVQGVTTSGRVLATASAEVARPIVASLPAFWWALFVDAGNAADTWGGLRPVLGYGAGLRWRSPVGPLRVDLAWADELREIRLHLSVGVTF